jgi:uncharacterized membrane protein
MTSSAAQAFSERRRLTTCAAAGTAVGVAVGLVGAITYGVLIGWDVLAGVFVAWTWAQISGMDAHDTRMLATREDDSRRGTSLLLTVAALLSLGGVGFALVEASRVGGPEKVTLTVIAVVTVLGSWTVVHTVFTLRYGHLFYTDPIGGIEFGGEENVSYRDFAYLAFTVGMTFQVSDTTITSREIRRVLLRHAVISYVFGTVILAMTINLLAGLAS